MASLTHALLDFGCRIVGYDKLENRQTDLLKKRGVRLFHSFEEFRKVSDLFLPEGIIYSSAIKTSPFLDWAIRNQIPIIHRAKALHELFSRKITISVAGSHGKTTTTAMISQILFEANLDPCVMIGGESPIFHYRGGRWGEGKYAVYESDESDGTFLHHCADYRILTNVDEDHLDYYRTRENVWQAFRSYVFPEKNPFLGKAKISEKSIAVIYSDDPVVKEILQFETDKKRLIAVGSNLDPRDYYRTYSLEIRQSSSRLFSSDGFQLEFTIPFEGDHYRINASLAIALARELGLPSERIRESLCSYQGVSRRMEIVFRSHAITLIDDYGHHPTEIRAVISAISASRKNGTYRRTIVIFQPHRYTRTQNLYKEFAFSLRGADVLYLLPIYSAGEEEIRGVGSEVICEELRRLGEEPVLLSGIKEKDCKTIQTELREGDVVLTLGAGNVREWGIRLKEILTGQM